MYTGYSFCRGGGGGIRVKGGKGRGITLKVKSSLFCGGFYPFLGSPALFLRPSTVGIKTGTAGREKERKDERWGGKFHISDRSTEHQPKSDSLKTVPYNWEVLDVIKRMMEQQFVSSTLL